MLTDLTESIADYLQRPLYTICCDELGPSGQVAERKLSAALSLATKWKAVVRIDEADVFMAERSNSELSGSQMVSGWTAPFQDQI